MMLHCSSILYIVQRSYRSGKTGERQGICVVREKSWKYQGKILFLKSQGK